MGEKTQQVAGNGTAARPAGNQVRARKDQQQRAGGADGQKMPDLSDLTGGPFEYVDGGIGSARKLIQKFILDREAEKSASRDYKTALQELVQRESGQVLGYQLIGAEGPDHAKIFSVEVDLNGIPIGQGRGRSKKEAEQNAARAAIEKLRAGE